MNDTLLSLRERKKQARKERIVQAALDLFRQSGYENTTVEEIATAAEVGKGTFFNYFPTKEAVLLAISDQQMALMQESLEHDLLNNDIDLKTRLLQLFDTLAHFIESEGNPELVKLTVFEAMKHPETLRQRPNRIRLRNLIAALVEQGQTTQQLRADVDQDLITQALEGVYFQQIFEWCAAPDEISLAQRLRTAINLVLEGAATISDD